MSEDHDQVGTTRGDQPIEAGASTEGIAEAERQHEQEITSDRHQIGTTRGGQPIEDLD